MDEYQFEPAQLGTSDQESKLIVSTLSMTQIHVE